MRTVEIRQYEVLLRVREFCDAHRRSFPDGKATEIAYDTIVSAIAALSSHACATTTASREVRRARKAARVALIKKLEAVARIARVIADDEPGFDESFSFPKQETEQTLLTTARVYMQAIELGADVFADHGMPTAIADLQALVVGFEQAIRAGDEWRKQSASAHKDIKKALSAGGAAARKLHAIATVSLPEGSELRAQWDRDRRLDYQRKRNTRRKPAGRQDRGHGLPAPPV